MASLDLLATHRAMTLLRDPPAHRKFVALKDLLLRRYTFSDAEGALGLSGWGDGSGTHGEHAVLARLG